MNTARIDTMTGAVIEDGHVYRISSRRLLAETAKAIIMLESGGVPPKGLETALRLLAERIIAFAPGAAKEGLTYFSADGLRAFLRAQLLTIDVVERWRVSAGCGGRHPVADLALINTIVAGAVVAERGF